MKEILVSGSTAYDNILHYNGLFGNQFTQGPSDVALNASFLTESFEKNTGGTGANIVYNLALLSETPILLTSIGNDFDFDGIIKDKVNLKYIHKDSMKHTAHSVILSDNEDNRITAFHPGAMTEASASKIEFIKEEIALAIVSANNVDTMLEHARDLKKKEIPFFADPAQQISQMSKVQIQELVHLSDHMIVNQYELKELQLIGGFTDEDLVDNLDVLIVTYGEQGSQLIQEKSMIHIPAIAVDTIQETTGAGDAYRAGVLKARIEGYDWKTACQLGTILSSYCVLASGSQHHHFNLGSLMEDMKKYFGVEMDLFKKRQY